MKIRTLVICGLLLCPARVTGQTFDPSIYTHWNLPHWADSVLATTDTYDQYDLFKDLNPFFQTGDFDGDGRPDLAIQIIRKDNHKRGIAIPHRSSGAVDILGAGNPMGNGGDDFSWLWVWRVQPRKATTDPRLTARDQLYVESPESAGGVIWWNGRRYIWIQAGD
jgi:hypothetical protein